MAIAQFENCLRIMSSKIVNCLGGKGAISSVLTEIGPLNSPLECSHCSKVHNGRASSPAGSAFFARWKNCAKYAQVSSIHTSYRILFYQQIKI